MIELGQVVILVSQMQTHEKSHCNKMLQWLFS